MLIVDLDELRPGMRLAAPIPHPEHLEQELLRRGYVMEDQVLPRLRDLGITTVCVEYPGLDDLDRHLEPFLTPGRRRLYGQIKAALAHAQRGTVARIPFRDYYDNIRVLITTLMMQGPNAIFLEQVGRMGDESIAHAASVAHLSLLLGLRLDHYLVHERKRLRPYQAKDVVNLGLAGMLHDVGKASIPEALRGKNEVSHFATDADYSDYQSHAQAGYDMIRDSIEPSAASAVLNHHQHFDGTGFPPRICTDGVTRRLDGSAVHVFPRILQVADLFHRLAEARSAHKHSSLVTLFDMRTKYAAWCDPTVLQALHGVTPPFPPGLFVHLSDGTAAVIIRVDPAKPARPWVRRVGENQRLDKTVLDLANPGLPSIERIGDLRVKPYLPSAAFTAAA